MYTCIDAPMLVAQLREAADGCHRFPEVYYNEIRKIDFKIRPRAIQAAIEGESEMTKTKESKVAGIYLFSHIQGEREWTGALQDEAVCFYLWSLRRNSSSKDHSLNGNP